MVEDESDRVKLVSVSFPESFEIAALCRHYPDHQTGRHAQAYRLLSAVWTEADLLRDGRM